jgi:hypothetical protein
VPGPGVFGPPDANNKDDSDESEEDRRRHHGGKADFPIPVVAPFPFLRGLSGKLLGFRP